MKNFFTNERILTAFFAYNGKRVAVNGARCESVRCVVVYRREGAFALGIAYDLKSAQNAVSFYGNR